MLSNWKREQRRTLMGALLFFAIWTFAIYWQGDISLRSFLDSALLLFLAQFSAIPAPFDSLFTDLLIIVFGSALAIIFFAHFVVPINSTEDFFKVLKLMSGALLGKRVKAINLRNGIDTNTQTDISSGTLSVALLDVASAAVLRNEGAFTRAIGPGLHFPEGGERVAGTLDLRIQERMLGPLPEDQPFLSQSKGEDGASYLARQERREESTGLTKDGIEVVPRIEVRFQVEGQQISGGAPFPFQGKFAWRTIANEGISPQKPSDIRNRSVGWDWLPVQLAGDLWRVFLRKYTLEEIFKESKQTGNEKWGKRQESGLQEIESLINERLKSALVEGKDKRSASPEYQLLRNRGIRVLSAQIREIHIDTSREESRLINEWSENWELHAIEKNISSEESVENEKSRGIYSAAIDFVQSISQDLVHRLAITDGEKVFPPDNEESLSLLIDGTIRNAKEILTTNPAIMGELLELKDFSSTEDENES